MSFTTTFKANMLPKMVQRNSPECVFSRISTEFTTPLDFTMDATVVKTANQPIYQPNVGDKFGADIGFSNADDSLDWEVVTDVMQYDGSSTVTLNLRGGSFNDVKSATGTMTIEFKPDSNVIHVDGSIPREITTMPSNNGGELIPSAFFSTFALPIAQLIKSYADVHLETKLIATPSGDLSEFTLTFTELGLRGDLKIEGFSNPHPGDAFDFTGMIHLEDTAKTTFTTDMILAVSVDSEGVVSGHLVSPSNVSQNSLTAFITGSWQGSELMISFERGQIIPTCSLAIPTYSTTIQGSIVISH